MRGKDIAGTGIKLVVCSFGSTVCIQWYFSSLSLPENESLLRISKQEVMANGVENCFLRHSFTCYLLECTRQHRSEDMRNLLLTPGTLYL